MKISRKSKQQIEARHKEKQVLELRIAGYEFQQIADQLGYASSGACHNAFKRALSRVPVEAVEQYRETESLKLNQLQRAIWTEAIQKKDRKLIETILRIMQRRASLLGLDLAKQLTQDEVMGSLKDALSSAEARDQTYTPALAPHQPANGNGLTNSHNRITDLVGTPHEPGND